MAGIRAAAALLGLVVPSLLAFAAEPDYRAMLGDHEGRVELIRRGAEVLAPLLAIAAGEEPALADEAERTVRWIASRASRAGERRGAAVAALLDGVQESDSLRARTLAVGALALCGRGEVVEPLTAMLDAPELAPAACRALMQLPVSGATEALANAFAKAEGEMRALLGRALAARRDPEAAAVVATMFGDEQLRDMAFQWLRQTPGEAAAKEMAAALGAAEPHFRARLLRALAERGSPLALEPAAQYAEAKDEAVRLAAIEALGRVGGADAASLLVEASDSEDAETAAAALTACCRVAHRLADAGKGERAGELFAHVLARSESPAQRISALAGVARLGLPSAIPAVVPLLEAGGGRVQVAAARTLGAIPGDEATSAIRQGLGSESPALRVALLDALAQRADPAALPDVVAAAKDPHEAVQVAALEALAAMPSASAEPVILAALERDSQAVRKAAADAYLALGFAALEDGDRTKALAAFHKILELPLGRERWLEALEGVERVASRHSAPVVRRHLDSGDVAVRDAAARAYMAIAMALAAAGDREQATEMLTTVLKLRPPAPSSPQAVEKLRAIGTQVDIPAEDGIVSSWWTIGAWRAEQKDWAKPLFPEGEVDLHKVYRVDGREVRWRAHTTDDPHGTVLLDPLFEIDDEAVAYAYTEIHVPEARDVVFEVGSDDAAILWLNSRRIYTHLEPRPYAVDQDTVQARLAAGPNRVLLKVCEGSGSWAFHLRVRDGEGNPLPFVMR